MLQRNVTRRCATLRAPRILNLGTGKGGLYCTGYRVSTYEGESLRASFSARCLSRIKQRISWMEVRMSPCSAQNSRSSGTLQRKRVEQKGTRGGKYMVSQTYILQGETALYNIYDHNSISHASNLLQQSIITSLEYQAESMSNWWCGDYSIGHTRQTGPLRKGMQLDYDVRKISDTYAALHYCSRTAAPPH